MEALRAIFIPKSSALRHHRKGDFFSALQNQDKIILT